MITYKKISHSTSIAVYALILMIMVVAFSVVFLGSPVSAQTTGGAGSGGTGSGGSGAGHYTRNGHGWAIYPIPAPGEEGGPTQNFRNDDVSLNVVNFCRSVGAPQLYVYIVLNDSGQAKGYDYLSHWENFRARFGRADSAYSYYQAVDEGRGITIPSNLASTEFSRLRSEGIIPDSLTFGVDVSWFCSGGRPRWQHVVSNTVTGTGTGQPSSTQFPIVGGCYQVPTTLSFRVNSRVTNTGETTSDNYYHRTSAITSRTNRTKIDSSDITYVFSSSQGAREGTLDSVLWTNSSAVNPGLSAGASGTPRHMNFTWSGSARAGDVVYFEAVVNPFRPGAGASDPSITCVRAIDNPVDPDPDPGPDPGPTDVCPNLPGNQTSVPSPYTLVGGQCVVPTPGPGPSPSLSPLVCSISPTSFTVTLNEPIEFIVTVSNPNPDPRVPLPTEPVEPDPDDFIGDPAGLSAAEAEYITDLADYTLDLAVYNIAQDEYNNSIARGVSVSYSITGPQAFSGAPVSSTDIPPSGSLPTINISETPAVPGSYTVTVSINGGSPISCGGGGSVLTSTGNVVQHPYSRVYGGDIIAGGGSIGVGGSCSIGNTGDVRGFALGNGPANFRGSGVELAVFATGVIQGVQPTAYQTTLSALTLAFANSGSISGGNWTPDFGGNFDNQICSYDYASDIDDATDGIGSTVDIATLADDAHRYSGNVTLSSSGIPNGRHVVVYATGDITITGSTFGFADTNWSSVDEIPSIYVVSTGGNIYIDRGVSRIDAVLVAQNGEIHTCSLGGIPILNTNTGVLNGAQVINSCASKLTVYGSFIADEIHLLRTNGTISRGAVAEGPTSAQQAEVFINSPEQYLNPNRHLVKEAETGASSTEVINSILSLPPSF